jgi:hypothetical protein
VSFTVSDFNDFKQLLALHPEWQVELRRTIVGNDLEALPSLVRDLVEAQRRSEERLAGVESRLAGVESRLNRLELAIEKLTEAVRISERRLTWLEERTGGMLGELLEMRYRAAAYFGRWLRRIRVVDPSALADELETHLSSEDLHEAMNIDLVVRGRLKQRSDVEEIWLAVKISLVVDREDVLRAVKRADLIRSSTGRQVLPVAAGKDVTQGAELHAADRKVFLLHNGSGRHWEEALERWIE